MNQTARDVVTGAMRDLGVLPLVDDPAAEELQYGLDQLDLMLKALAAEGLLPWNDQTGTADFAAGQAEATLTPTPVEVSEARAIMSATYERQLYRWEGGEYASVPNKSQRGTPVRFDLRFTPTEVKMRLWPVPLAATSVAYTYTAAIDDVAATTVIDVPPMWGDAIRKMLKARLAPFMPDGMPQYVIAEAEIAKARLLDFDRPESYVLGAFR